jgi:hypothetical protein
VAGTLESLPEWGRLAEPAGQFNPNRLFFCFEKGGPMEKWTPIFWILGGGVGYLSLLIFFDSVKGMFKGRKKNRI